MVYITKAFLVAVIVASPALSIPVQINEQELVARDPGLFGGILNIGKKILGFRRELDDSLDVRELIDELETRDLSGEELDARDPGLFGGILNIGKKILGFRRELDDSLDARDLINELESRGLSAEELDAREPGLFGGILNIGKKILGFRRDVDEDIVARELYEELAARGVVPELDTREMSTEDLVARDPGIFGGVLGAVKGALLRRDEASFDGLD